MIRLRAKGRGRVLLVNGLVYFGGSVFLLLNAVDFFVFDNGSPFQPVDLLRLAAYLIVSLLAGYLYGRATWKTLSEGLSSEDF